MNFSRLRSLSIFVFLTVAVFVLLVQSQTPTCDATHECSIGCCGQFGVCGLGPDFCGEENCTSTCNYKSECDPGWGPEWSAAEKCPLNVCCSKFGFCGTTTDFCGSDVVKNPSCSGTSSSKRTVGYYEAWSIGRPCDVMYPEDIPVSSYTHLNFAFASIDPNSFAVAQMDVGDTDLYSRLTGMKILNPGLQVWISIGGWSMNDPDQPTATTFSQLAASTTNQQAFFKSLLCLMTTYGFDGVDIDWEYPGAPDRSGRPEDFANYVTFLQNLRTYWQRAGHNYGLSITIPSSFWYLRNFDIVNLEKEIDWFNMMSYDLHGTWDSADVYIGPYVAAHTNLTEIDSSLKLLWRNNIDPSKVNLGLGFYGRSFTLTDPSCTHAGCGFSAAAPAGPCTQSPGTLSFAEIKQIIAGGAKPVLDSTAAVQTLVYDTQQWVSYDDETTLRMKLDYANRNCLGGTLVWAVSLDDSVGTASNAISSNTGVSKNYAVGITIIDQISQCLWTNCGPSAACPFGMTAAGNSAGGKATSDRQCPKGQVRTFCCPNDNVPNCKWEGGGTKFCGGSKCADGWIVVGASRGSCWTSHLSLCCEPLASVQKVGECEWTGSSPFCGFGKTADAAACPSGQLRLTTSSSGDGGEEPCQTGAKSLCCNNPAPWSNCAWYNYGDPGSIRVTGACVGTCPAGLAVLSVDPWAGGCITGASAFCCGITHPPAAPPFSPFQAMIDEFLADPQCQEYDAPTSDAVRRRGLELNESQVFDLQERGLSDPFSVNSFIIAVTLNRLIAYNGLPTVDVQTLRAYWNRAVQQAQAGWSFLTIDHLRAWIAANPDQDPLESLNDILCVGTAASASIQDYEAAQTELCDCGDLDPSEATPRTPATDMNLMKRDYDRNTNANGQPTMPGHLPAMGRAVQRINNGELQFVYYRWFRYNGPITRPAYADQTIELEVVYLLSGNENQPFYNDLQQTTTGANQDRFLILHFHFEATTRRPSRGQRPQPVMAVSQVNIRHASTLSSPRSGGRNSAGLWRAQSRARRGQYLIECLRDERLWCPPSAPQRTQPWAGMLEALVTNINAEVGAPGTALFGTLNPPNVPAGVNFQTGNWGRNVRMGSSPAYNAAGGLYSPPPGYTTLNGLVSFPP